MAETKERVITLEIELPHEFRIVRYGDSDTLELESMEFDFDIKTRKKLKTKSWKFSGFYTTLNTALKGYMNKVGVKRLSGKHDLKTVTEFMKSIEESVEEVSRTHR